MTGKKPVFVKKAVCEERRERKSKRNGGRREGVGQ
jgi:hypothetical protein